MIRVAQVTFVWNGFLDIIVEHYLSDAKHKQASQTRLNKVVRK